MHDLQWPLDDLIPVLREFSKPRGSRSGLDHCLLRQGACHLRTLKPKEVQSVHVSFKSYEPGYLDFDNKYLPQKAAGDRQRNLFVALNRATRGVFVQIYSAQTAGNVRHSLCGLARAAPMKITRVLTDNEKAFEGNLLKLPKYAATREQEFDQLCADLVIEQHLTQSMQPRTDGMVELFNVQIEDVLQSHRSRSGEDLEQTDLLYFLLQNTHLLLASTLIVDSETDPDRVGAVIPTQRIVTISNVMGGEHEAQA